MKNRNTHLMAGLVVLAAAPWIMATTTSGPQVGDDSTIVTITGTGVVEQKVPLITIQAGVESFATTASRALAENSDTMLKLRTQLRRHGIDPKDVRTTGLQMGRGSKHEDSDVKGFNVSHNLTIVFRDIDKSGIILDALVNAGANQIHGPRFSWEAGDQALRTARAAAIRDADTRAKFFASALGLKVKRVVTMRDGGGYASGEPRTYDVARAATQIDPGQDVVRASVYGEYELVK